MSNEFEQAAKDPERERYNKLANELEELYNDYSKRFLFRKMVVEWIIEDLRSGNIQAIKVNCENQSDKFGDGRNELKDWLLINIYEDNLDEFPWSWGYKDSK